MYKCLIGFAAVIVLLLTGGCMEKQVNPEEEKAVIKQVIENSIGWAKNKDTDLLYSCFAHDANLFWYVPENNDAQVGFESFKDVVNNVFMNDAFKAVRFETKDMVINLSRDGSVAWWHCLLDDVNEWNGQQFSWINVRWTGVLEKQDGKWVIVQQHFSNSVDDIKQRIQSKG
ncbi:MAG: nuclear transport factor 2 family protein [Candidatus Zixiibacteriota bacterium]